MPMPADRTALIEVLETLLPQTQCRQCGFDGCAEYARAMVEDGAAVNRCAPGGQAGVAKLAAALGREELALDPEYGRELPFAVARISPKECIGCALCAAACPVASITGVAKHLFAVIENECTGCGLCVCACPVSAVSMHEVERTWSAEDAAAARKRYQASQKRRQEAKARRTERLVAAGSDKAELLAAVLGRAKAIGKQNHA